ncbi:MAG: hydrogenase maturation protease [Coriobacteriia bacterium]|nr:hydrogenase maturation protease [Coriobacteriia bacterium]
MKIAIICVGNELMLDDGLGIEAYRQLVNSYEFPADVDVMCAGCMTMDMVSKVDEYDLMISVDAIDETSEPAGTIFRYTPDDVARRGTPMGSLHELKLADLFDAAALLDYECEGVCIGMQVENGTPSEFIQGLTPTVNAKMPMLIDTILAELVNRGCRIVVKATGGEVKPGFHHVMTEAADA